MKHSKTIEKYSWTTKELWRDIVNLDYDSLVELFDVLTIEFAKDSVHDLELKHPQVSEKLINIANRLKDILEKDVKPLADLCRWYNQRGEV